MPPLSVSSRGHITIHIPWSIGLCSMSRGNGNFLQCLEYIWWAIFKILLVNFLQINKIRATLKEHQRDQFRSNHHFKVLNIIFISFTFQYPRDFPYTRRNLSSTSDLEEEIYIWCQLKKFIDFNLGQSVVADSRHCYERVSLIWKTNQSSCLKQSGLFLITHLVMQQFHQLWTGLWYPEQLVLISGYCNILADSQHQHFQY